MSDKLLVLAKNKSQINTLVKFVYFDSPLERANISFMEMKKKDSTKKEERAMPNPDS